MLELRGVEKRYRGIPAVDGVSFVARPGEITGYLGANGSGKSTTMKLITGLLQADAGEILLEGRPVGEEPMRFRQQLGYVPEEPQLYTHLSGVEYLQMVAQLRNMERRRSAKTIDGLLRLFGLDGDRDVALTSYSKGMRQKVLLSSALMHDPKLVLLDEPFSGLDVASSLMLRSLMVELARRGKVVLFSSHEMETVERLCSHVVILHRGRVVADDTIANLRQLMAMPNLEAIFAQLAIEQDTEAISQEIVNLIESPVAG